jgi:heme A synthase
MMTLHNNFLAFGSCIAGIGILMTGLLALLFRNPNAPRWARPEIVAMLICVPVSAMIGFGLGYAIYGLYQVINGAGDPRGFLVLAAVVIVLALLWRALRIRRRLKDYALATSKHGPSGPVATDSTFALGEPTPRPTAHGSAADLPKTSV